MNQTRTNIKITRPTGELVWEVTLPTRQVGYAPPDTPPLLVLGQDGRLWPGEMRPGDGGILPPWQLTWEEAPL